MLIYRLYLWYPFSHYNTLNIKNSSNIAFSYDLLIQTFFIFGHNFSADFFHVLLVMKHYLTVSLSILTISVIILMLSRQSFWTSFIFQMISSVFEEQERPTRYTSSTLIRPSRNRLCYSKTHTCDITASA